LSNLPAIDTEEIIIEATEVDQFDQVISAEMPSSCIKKIKDRLTEGGMEQDDAQLAALLLQICMEEAIARASSEPLWGPMFLGTTAPTMPEDGHPFKTTFALDIAPELQWPEFSTFEVRRPLLEIGAEEVRRELHRQRLEAGTNEGISGPAATDDLVHVDLVVCDIDSNAEIITLPSMKGRVGPDGEAILLDGLSLPEIDKGIRDRNRGDRSELKTSLPDSITGGRNGSKTYRVSVILKEIHRTTPASVQQVIDQYGTPNEEILHRQIQVSLEKSFEFNQRSFMINELFTRIRSSIDYTPPQRELNRLLRTNAQEMRKNIMKNGGTMEDAATAWRANLEQLTEESMAYLKRKGITIMLQRKLTLSLQESDLNNHIAKLALLAGKRPEDLRKELTDSDRLPSISAQAVEGKIFDELREQLSVVDIDADTLE
jgi:FKBP-type peptidyl-prolyl cis-trans isomerase (trigger factor)